MTMRLRLGSRAWERNSPRPFCRRLAANYATAVTRHCTVIVLEHAPYTRVSLLSSLHRPRCASFLLPRVQTVSISGVGQRWRKNAREGEREISFFFSRSFLFLIAVKMYIRRNNIRLTFDALPEQYRRSRHRSLHRLRRRAHKVARVQRTSLRLRQGRRPVVPPSPTIARTRNSSTCWFQPLAGAKTPPIPRGNFEYRFRLRGFCKKGKKKRKGNKVVELSTPSCAKEHEVRTLITALSAGTWHEK